VPPLQGSLFCLIVPNTYVLGYPVPPLCGLRVEFASFISTLESRGWLDVLRGLAASFAFSPTAA
jgi:hypothetical protein